MYLEHDEIDGYIAQVCSQSVDENGVKIYVCSVCQKVTRAKQDIERHIESQHIQTRPFECTICGSSHKNRRYLKVHLASHK